MGKIVTGIKNVISRRKVLKTEELAKEDLLKSNKDNILADVSQRRGIMMRSGLTIAERDYILSDSMIASALQLYLADILNICDIKKYNIITSVTTDEDDTDNSKKKARVDYILKQILSNDDLIEAIAINLLNNGEIFLSTEYNKGTNNINVTESSYACCTQLQFSNGETAAFVCSDAATDASGTSVVDIYNYNLNANENEIVKPHKMARIYNPTLSNSKVCIPLDDDNDQLSEFTSDNNLYYTGSQSLLKQIYPDWLNSKLLELAVYRDRIARSRFIQLIAIELGRTGKITSDQIYENVRNYFDKRAVIDLEQQTFKSVVGDEPFTDYKVYTTRNGVGQLTFDNSLNNTNTDVSSLADLEYNQTKLFAGLGIPKQYLGADDNGSALSNGGSLFFIDEKYQKRVIAYVKRIARGLKECVKNIIYQQEADGESNSGGNEFFHNWDFVIEFEVPDTNEDVYRVKNSRIEYVNALLDLVDRVEEAKKSDNHSYSVDEIGNIIQEDISKLVNSDVGDDDNKTEGE